MARTTQLTINKDGSYTYAGACESRDRLPSNRRDITATLPKYLPLDEAHTSKWEDRNIFGWIINRQKIKSGAYYSSFDGTRLVLEVGCETVIYILNNPTNPGHHRVFLEPTKEFNDAISARLRSKQVVDATRPIVTIAKYEMFFLMGMVSTMSVPAWLAVTGTDMGFMFISQKIKMDAAKDLGGSLANESNDIKTYAPVLHAKLLELLLTEPEASAKEALKQLPSDIIHNEKAQAQVAGILFGKMAVAPKSFTLSALFITILTQIAVKSATNSPGSYGQVINSKYGNTVAELVVMDLQDPKQSVIASQKLSTLFKGSGVTLTELESQKILQEVALNPKKLQVSLQNLDSSFSQFNKAIAND